MSASTAAVRLAAFGLALTWASAALALPKFEVQQVAGLSLAVPQGWTVQQANQPVPTIRMEEKPGSTTSPSVILMTWSLAQGQFASMPPAQMAQRLVQTVMVGPKQVNAQQAGGGSLTEWAGQINGAQARLVVVHQANAQVGVVAAFAAPAARYKALGGAHLLMTVMSGQAPKQPVARRSHQGGSGLSVPARYRRSSRPTLDYVVDAFERLSPAQAAQALRQMNGQEWQLLGIYRAFTELLHAHACQADGSLRLPTGASCAQTLARWQQTLQLLGNNQQAATEQARRERAQLQIAGRCERGEHDRASCAAYQTANVQMKQQSHETMSRHIRSWGTVDCQVGEPGCMPR